jgi:hypothetical protein
MSLAKVMTAVAVAGGVLAGWLPAAGPAIAMGLDRPASVHDIPASLGFAGQVRLGGASAVPNWPGGALVQGPNGSLYYADGSAVSEVKGLAAPVVVLHTPGTVLALAAGASDLYVEVGQRIYDYGLGSMTLQRSWTLPSVVRHVTLAGLLVGPGVIWAWSDWATDESGFELASIVEISTTTSLMRVIANNTAYPAYMAAGSAGLYYEYEDATSASPVTEIVHALPDGTQQFSKPIAISTSEPLALWSGYVGIFADSGPSNTPYLDLYSASSLAKLASPKLAFTENGVIGTPSGLLAIDGNYVVYVNPRTGATSEGVEVPGAWALLFGPQPSVIATYKGTDYLVRLT